MATTEIESYRIILNSGDDHSDLSVLISLYDAQGAHIGNVRFTDEHEPGLAVTYGYPLVTLPQSHYSYAIDMLRNESPVYFSEQMTASGWIQRGGLQTGTGEVVGEDDGRTARRQVDS